MKNVCSARNREELESLVASGAPAQYLLFWRPNATSQTVGKECFSQWYPSLFEIDGQSYTTAEHYMMAEKARLFDDEEHREQIINAASPAEVRSLGRKVRGFVEKVWKSKCTEIVIAGNVAKFGQDQALLEFLRSTLGQVLVEASPRDRIWGIGMGENNANAKTPSQWRGRNLLGFALMEAREQLLATRN